MTDQRDFPSTTEENQDEVKRNKKKGKWGTKHTWMDWAGDIRGKEEKQKKKKRTGRQEK